jgi:superfamily II DNA or RNA helicase
VKLWPHQSRALDSLRAAIAAGKRRICVVSPTGSGKGTIASEIFRLLQGKGLFLVHRREIILDQANRVPGSGIILPGYNAKPFARIQIASVETLLNRDTLPEADVIVIDECHHYVKNSWGSLIGKYPNSIIIGLTATPERADGRPLAHFEELIVAAQYSELIAAGLICPAQVYQPAAELGGDLALDPVAAYEKYTPGMKGFVFLPTVEMAHSLKFNVPTATITAKTPKNIRDRAIEDLRAGRIKLILNYGTMTEGVDCPDAQVCILARRCIHTGTYLQIAGRVLRSAPGKRHAVLLDLVGASLKHGLPHIDRQYTLDGRGGFDLSKLPPLTVCVACGLTQLAGRATCEGCGFVFLRQARKLPRIYSEELRRVYDFEKTPEDAKLEEFLRLVNECDITQVIARYKDLFGSEPSKVWLLNLPRERRMHELERWKAEGEQRGFKRGYSFARYLATFGVAP